MAAARTLKKSIFLNLKPQGTLFLKVDMTRASISLIYITISSTCKEDYIGETGEETKLRKGWCILAMGKPNYQQLRCEEHFRACGNGNFELFPFLKPRCDNKALCKKISFYMG